MKKSCQYPSLSGLKAGVCACALVKRLLTRWGQCLLIAAALAACLPANAAMLRLGAPLQDYDTAGYLERLDDPAGALDAAAAAAAPGWTALPGSLNAGFTASAIWLRLTLNVDATEADGWMLRLSSALLDDVEVYALPPGQGPDAWRLIGHSGQNVPRDEWLVAHRTPAFRFAPETPGRYVLLLRLATKHGMATRLEIMPKPVFENQARREGLLFGVYTGFYLLLIGLHAVFWRMTHARESRLFFAYIGICVSNEVLFAGVIQQMAGLSATVSSGLVGLCIAIALPVGTAMFLRQLGAERLYPQPTRWTIRLFAAYSLVCAALILSGHFALGMRPMQILGLALILTTTLLALRLAWRGWRLAYHFLLIFSPFYAGVVIGFLRNFGIVPVNSFTQYSSVLGTMIHLLLLNLVIIGRHERRRRARESRQATLAAELAMQRKMLAEQRDFVAMVSHEFRTPLEIIGMSVQQLSRNLYAPPEKSQARCRNIREAALRLLSLVEQYLTDDRIREPRAELRNDFCDVPAMLADLVAEYAPDRIRYEFDPLLDALRCDPDLLRIALRNLLANADRHAPDDSVIDVMVRRDGDMLCITVANPGEQIPETEHERLFQKYYRGQNARHKPGAGLGLYLVHRIATRLGGSVTLAQAGGDESVIFQFRLPLDETY
jgi:signal transduction histidine kinase